METLNPGLEIEAKLVLPDAAALDHLDALLEAAGLRVESETSARICDHYVDTLDWSFYRAGLACRLRRRPADTVLTFKSLSPVSQGIATRAEWEQVVRDPPPRRLPEGALAERFAPALGGRGLRLLAEVHQRRRVLEVSHGELRVEVSADRVIWQTPEGEVEQAFVELELLEGPPEALPALRDALTGEGWRPDDCSKFARALFAANRPPPVKPKAKRMRPLPEDTVGEALCRILDGHAQKMVWHDAGTRLGIDPLHLKRMRVASRRLLAAADVFHEALPPALYGALRRRVKQVARTLGAIRDLDVNLEALDGYAARIEGDSSALIGTLRSHLEARRRAAREAMLEWQLGDYRVARALLDHALETGPDWATEASLRRVAEVAPEHMKICVDRVLEDGRAITPESDEEAYHELRRKTKRLRYTAEFFKKLASTPMKAMVKRQVALQDLLGEHQDACVAAELFEAYAQTVTLAPIAKAQLAQLRAHQMEKAAQLREGFPALWADFDDATFLAEVQAGFSEP